MQATPVNPSAQLAAQLTRPSPAYKNSARLAVDAVKMAGQYGAPMKRFLDAVAAGRQPREAARLLAGMHPAARGYAYSAALVLAGARAPAAWRQHVNSVLFASERPYFHAG